MSPRPEPSGDTVVPTLPSSKPGSTKGLGSMATAMHSPELAVLAPDGHKPPPEGLTPPLPATHLPAEIQGAAGAGQWQLRLIAAGSFSLGSEG